MPTFSIGRHRLSVDVQERHDGSLRIIDVIVYLAGLEPSERQEILRAADEVARSYYDT